MGLFSKDKPAIPKFTDKVWKTRQACLKGLAKEALLAIQEGNVAVALSLFEKSHQELLDFMTGNKVPTKSSDSFGSEMLQDRSSVFVVNLSSPGILRFYIPKETPVRILFLGHYPMITTENKLLESIHTHLPSARVSFCLSLEDAFFDQFGSDRIRPLMETLGMEDDECIEHDLVSRAIKNALEKVNKGLTAELRTKSEEDWFARNVRK